MNRTGIEWCDYTWNPMTGCYNGCSYCYARNIARRFCTNEHGKEGVLSPCDGKCNECHKMDGPEFWNERVRIAPEGAVFPYGFYPTFYPDRLDEPAKAKKPKTIFVGSMTDLFGRWVSASFIVQVLDACAKAPQHRYCFLTKNPDRYNELDILALLPYDARFWFGATVTKQDDIRRLTEMPVHLKTFWSMEPLHGPVDMNQLLGCTGPFCDIPDRIIIGAETGNRKGKIIPRREWVTEIMGFCKANGIPVLVKDNLRKLYPDLPETEFSWEGTP